MTPPPETSPAPPPARRRLRLAAWVAVVAALLAGTPAWLFLLRGPRLLDHHATLFAGWALLGSAVLAMLWLLRTTPADAITIPPRVGRWTVVGGAAWLQACAVALLVPVLSDDALRYRLDGKLWLLGHSPYAVTPDRAAALAAGGGETLRPDAIDRLVTSPELPTIYLPASQAAFVAIRAVGYTLLPEPPAVAGVTWRDVAPQLPFAQRLLFWRLASALAAVAATLLLTSILHRRRQSVWAAAAFGWNPLVVIEAGGMAHQDLLGVALLLAAVRSHGRVQFGRACLCLVAAALVKPLAILLLPFVLRDAVRRGRRLRRAAIGGGVPLALAAPVWAYQHGYAGWWQSMTAYLKVWQVNGPLFEALSAAGVGPVVARAIGAAVVLAAGAWLWRRRADPPTAGHGLILALLLASPVVYPWYLTWALCLVPLLRRGGAATVVWSATAGLSYALWPTLERTGAWALPASYLVAEYAPVFTTLAIGAFLARRGSRAALPGSDAGDSSSPPPAEAGGPGNRVVS